MGFYHKTFCEAKDATTGFTDPAGVYLPGREGNALLVSQIANAYPASPDPAYFVVPPPGTAKPAALRAGAWVKWLGNNINSRTGGFLILPNMGTHNFYIQANGTVSAYGSSGSPIATSTQAFATGIWYFVEGMIKPGPSGTGRMEFLVDGATWISATGTTLGPVPSGTWSNPQFAKWQSRGGSDGPMLIDAAYAADGSDPAHGPPVLPIPVTGAAKIWDGSAWRSATTAKIWDGSAWRSSSAASVWDGTVWYKAEGGSPPALTYPETVLADGPVGYWRLTEADPPFAEASGGPATQFGSLVNGGGGSLLPNGEGNSATWPTGGINLPIAQWKSFGLQLGTTYSEFMGAGPYSAFTFECWADLASNVAWWRTLLASNKTTAGCHIAFKSNVINNLSANIYTSPSGANAQSTAPEPVADQMGSGKHHYVVTYDAADGFTKMYVNGLLTYKVVSSAPGAPMLGPGSDSPMVVGAAAYNASNTHHFQGRIAEVAVYDRALTQDRVKAHWAAAGGAPILPPTIVSLDPADTATNVAANTDISVTYSRGVSPGAVITTVPASSGSTTTSGTTITHVSDAPFPPGTAIQVSVTGVVSLDGMAASDVSWGFTTAVPEWTRPTDWLPPTIAAGELATQILSHVADGATGTCSFMLSKAGTVDWGDGGGPVAAGANAVMGHTYTGSALPANETSEGKRQVVATITHPTGTEFTLTGTTATCAIAEVATGGGLTMFGHHNNFGNKTNVRHLWALSPITITEQYYWMYRSPKLEAVSGGITCTGGSWDGAFQECPSLVMVASVTAQHASATFTNLTTNSPAIREFGLLGAKNSFSVANTSMPDHALERMFAGLATASGGATVTITGAPGAATCDKSIATDKGWAVVG